MYTLMGLTGILSIWLKPRWFGNLSDEKKYLDDENPDFK